MLSIRLAVALAVALPAIADPALTVHEWGTFTSIAGPEGRAVPWQSLSGDADLPAFVHRLAPHNIKGLRPGLVRMETPVLYFYATEPVAASVNVRFPKGLITEWYPRASVAPEVLDTALDHGRIDWNHIEITPGVAPDLPRAAGASHYYAARETDAAPVRVGEEQEKLLFYRGVGNFQVPLEPQFLPDGSLEIRNTGTAVVPLAIVFENRGGYIGFRVLHGITDKVAVAAPELDGDRSAVKRVLAAGLEEMGLYRKEAEAMLATWADSWFEEGTRVVYLMPRATVDLVLPLAISPEPQQTVRAFVGRIEMLSPSMRSTIQTALAAHDSGVLAKYGRFLPVFLDQLRASGQGEAPVSVSSHR